MEKIQTLSKTKISIFLFFVLLGIFFIIPNFFSEVPVIQIQGMNPSVINHYQDRYDFNMTMEKNGDLEIAFKNISDQLDFFQEIKKLNTHAQINLNLKPRTPAFFQRIGLKPMRLGLDLRGGVHFILSVDQQTVIEKQMSAWEDNIRLYVKKEYPSSKFSLIDHVINMEFPSREIADQALDKLNNAFPEYQTTYRFDVIGLQMNIHPHYLSKERLRILETTITSMRNRINELGVAEASIYTQGLNQIVIDLPGIQDVKQAKELIGKTATIDFYLAYQGAWKPGAAVPFGSILKKDKNNQMVPLLKRAVLSGDAIVFAQAGMTPEGNASVDLRITTQKAKDFRALTADNVGKPMAVVYKETYTAEKWNPQTGAFETVPQTQEYIINIATINSALGERFQITGLNREQSFQLALMLRAGSLPANVSIVEEKTIGPSLGADNIKMGMYSLLLGISLVFSFMIFYYRALGVIANLTLLSNLSLLVMSLALIQATLTLPGIAGIVLTIGMAVDANVLIFERIKEELAAGCPPWTALDRGFTKAADTIMDSNFTTMIIGFVLFFLGSGAIKGFAVTLCIGLVTSMITALVGTKVFIHLWWRKELFPKITFFSIQAKQG